MDAKIKGSSFRHRLIQKFMVIKTQSLPISRF